MKPQAKPIAALVAAVTLGVAPFPALAQAPAVWQHEGDADVQFAFLSAADRELAVRCSGDQIEVVYYISVDALDPAIKGLSLADIAFLVDKSSDLIWVPSAVVLDGNVVQIGVGGDDANDLAHSFATATDSVVVSLFPMEPTPTSMPYNNAVFPVAGAADAIKAAYAACGIKF